MSAGGAGSLLIHRVIARLNVGGPAMHVVNLARGLEPYGWRTRLIAGAVDPSEGDMGYYARERGVAVTDLPALGREIRPLDDLRSLWSLWRRFRSERPAVVHTHTAKAGMVGRLAAVLAGVPVRIHTYHGHVLGGGYFRPWKTRLFLALERQLARATSRLVVLTDAQRDEMSRDLDVAGSGRFAVVPLGLELDAFAAVDREREGAALRDDLGVGPDAATVGIVGRMVPIKNHELFLDAVAALRRRPEGSGVRALVVGSGEREEALRARADELGIGDAVHWLGWRRDLPRIYAALDVVALTSHDEGTPVALIEALAAGTKVVARDVGGVAELLAGAGWGAGSVVPREVGAEGWARALAQALDAPPPAPSAREAVRTRWSVERLAADLDALYRRELRRAGWAPPPVAGR